MATAWRFVAYYALPVPLALIFMLSIPAPRVFRKGVITFTHQVFGLPLVGAFKLLHVMLFLTGMALLSAVRVLKNLKDQEASAVWPTANAEITALSKRWRAERNSWIAAFAFTMWLVLAAFYREAVRRVQLEEKLAQMERSASEARGLPATTAGTAAAPAGREIPAGEASATSTAGRKKSAGDAADTAGPARNAPVAASDTQGIQMQDLKKDM